MKIFGSDGFRSKFGHKYMTFEFLTAFGSGIASYYLEKNIKDPILIGKDTRFSCDLIEDILTSVFIYNGIDTISVGVIPTPGLSSLCSIYDTELGIMITASHDPYENNGIKLFANDGYKLDADIEKVMESFIIESINNNNQKYNGYIGTNKIALDYSFSYVREIVNLLKDVSIKYKLLIDCCNGAYSDIIKHVFGKTSNVSFINNAPNGFNINLNCGALEPEMLLKKVKASNNDYGVAFDGDGDRAIFVSSNYGIIETEKLIVMFSQAIKDKREKTIVSTEICNKGLEVNSQSFGYKLIQTAVGDRNVVDKTLDENAIIGAEPSGHYFFPNVSCSMDGLIATIYFLKLLDTIGRKSIEDQLCDLSHYNRVRKDIIINENMDYNFLISSTKNSSLIGADEKLVIRKSMWDPVIRIYYDYKSVNNFKNVELFIKQTMSQK